MYEMTVPRKLSEISQLGAKETVSFRKLPADAKMAVLDRLGDVITADKLKATVADVNGKQKK